MPRRQSGGTSGDDVTREDQRHQTFLLLSGELPSLSIRFFAPSATLLAAVADVFAVLLKASPAAPLGPDWLPADCQVWMRFQRGPARCPCPALIRHPN